MMLKEEIYRWKFLLGEDKDTEEKHLQENLTTSDVTFEELTD